jgi:hypothetical protein
MELFIGSSFVAFLLLVDCGVVCVRLVVVDAIAFDIL